MASLPDAVRAGALVTCTYVLLYYLCLCGQAYTNNYHRALYRKAGKKFDRYYNSKDKKVLAWDRITGNMLEQAMPFLTLFWLNLGLCIAGTTAHGHIIKAGWTYVALRACYPVAWFSGGGGLGGPRPQIWGATAPMYSCIVYLFANAVAAAWSGQE